jgi:hypothetical protein
MPHVCFVQVQQGSGAEEDGGVKKRWYFILTAFLKKGFPAQLLREQHFFFFWVLS